MLRPFLDEDAQACCEIINDSIRDMSGLNDAAREFIFEKNQPDTLSAELNSFYTVVFEKEGELLGLGALAGNEIKRVYTKSSAQGMGIGTAIMNHLENEARRQGLPFIETEASPTSVQFYEKRGFHLMRPGHTRHGDAEFNFLVMRKALS